MLPRPSRFGDLNFTFIEEDQARIQSGTILSLDQSPPPITFPALAEAKAT